MKAQRLVTLTIEKQHSKATSSGSAESHLTDALKNGWQILSVTPFHVSTSSRENTTNLFMAVVLEKDFDTREYQEYKKFDTFRT